MNANVERIMAIKTNNKTSKLTHSKRKFTFKKMTSISTKMQITIVCFVIQVFRTTYQLIQLKKHTIINIKTIQTILVLKYLLTNSKINTVEPPIYLPSHKK